ncbi:MAG: hypothetical protein M1834_008723 [Cirrosporium novae-zelandiae]|nr:MAG: hypothetical protein M1834_008723 [Cirrosporium novae-zelandiae]
MSVRIIFAAAFLVFLLLTLIFTLSSTQIPLLNDKVAHFGAFFVLTICCYWAFESSRRRALNFTLIGCTAILGVGSEVLQGLLPNGRTFDIFDIVSNLAGSLSALVLSSWYHKRMLERRRRARHYHAVPAEESGEIDVELGEGRQETGIIPAPTDDSCEGNVDGWDDNALESWNNEGAGSGESDVGDRTSEDIGNSREQKHNPTS